MSEITFNKDELKIIKSALISEFDYLNKKLNNSIYSIEEKELFKNEIKSVLNLETKINNYLNKGE